MRGGGPGKRPAPQHIPLPRVAKIGALEGVRVVLRLQVLPSNVVQRLDNNDDSM
jgi:hypothetical protein